MDCKVQEFRKNDTGLCGVTKKKVTKTNLSVTYLVERLAVREKDLVWL